MGDAPTQLRRLAEFVGCGFTEDEGRDGVVERIVEVCGFKNLSSLDVNKKGSIGVDNRMMFRRGVVGDWANYLTPDMARRLDELTESKFRDSGLAI